MYASGYWGTGYWGTGYWGPDAVVPLIEAGPVDGGYRRNTREVALDEAISEAIATVAPVEATKTAVRKVQQHAARELSIRSAQIDELKKRLSDAERKVIAYRVREFVNRRNRRRRDMEAAAVLLLLM